MPPTHRSRSDPPDFIPPQLTKLSDSAPEGERWAHELKFDGYRMAARIVGKDVRMLTRTGLDWTEKYEAIATALAKLKVSNAYIDGEICAVRPDGTTSFSDLQAATDERNAARLTYFAFDLLFVDA